MQGQRHEIAQLQSDYYRDKFRRILRWLTWTTFIIVILIVAIIYLVLFQPTPNYYANTTNGIILDMPRQK